MNGLREFRMLVLDRSLGQTLNFYESEGGRLICQLVMQRAESYTYFEGLDENNERRISVSAVFTIAVNYLDKAHCCLNTAEKEFPVNVDDEIELYDENNEVFCRIIVMRIRGGCCLFRNKETTEKQSECLTGARFGFDYNPQKCFIAIKEK